MLSEQAAHAHISYKHAGSLFFSITLPSFLKVKMLKQSVYERYPESVKGSVALFPLLKAKNTTGETSDLRQTKTQINPVKVTGNYHLCYKVRRYCNISQHYVIQGLGTEYK